MAKLTALTLLLVAALAAAAAPGAEAARGRVVGKVASGEAPLRGFGVQLWQALPGAQRPRLLGTARSRGDGRFAIRYRGAARSGVHYLIANRTGGAGPDRPAPASAYRLAASLGAGPLPRRVAVNERTTVAIAFAMAQFLDGPRVSGESPGLENAAAMAANLVDPRSGRLSPVLRRFPNGRSTSTLATFGSLANLVASCRGPSRTCARFLRLARVPGRRRAAADTLRAATAIAANPWQSSAALFRRSLGARKAYRPFLGRGERPDAWTLALRFAGRPGTVDGPGAIAVDAAGGLWVTNAYAHGSDPSDPVCGGERLLRFAPSGEPHPGSPYAGGGLGGAGFGIGIDPRGRVWVGSSGFAGGECASPPPGNRVSLFDSAGSPLSPAAGYGAGAIDRPQGTVADLDGNVWIANCAADSVTRYANGMPERAASLAETGLARPFGVAVGRRGTVFVTGNGNDRVAVLGPDGSLLDLVADQRIDHPVGVAADSRGYAWVAGSAGLSVSCDGDGVPGTGPAGDGSLALLDPAGRVLASYRGAGLDAPWAVAVDGDDTVWVANYAGRRLSHLCGAQPGRCPGPKRRRGAPISPGGGYGFDGLTRSAGIAIDPSGNVWLANTWQEDTMVPNPGGHQIVAFLGLAAPIRTPLIGPPERP